MPPIDGLALRIVYSYENNRSFSQDGAVIFFASLPNV